MGACVLPRPGERVHCRRAHQLGGRNGAQGDADQLLRAAGRRQHLGRRERRRHLRRAQRGGGDDAPRWRRGLRLLAHPAAGCARARHQQPRERPAVVHACIRPELRDGRIGRLAPRRADGHFALRSPGHRGVHPRQGRRRAHQLQHLGRRHRCVRRGRARRQAVGPRAPGAAGPRPARRRRAPARGRPVGLSHGARTLAVGPDDALDVRPRRAGCRVHRHGEPRQQSVVLRDDRGHESVRYRGNLGDDCGGRAAGERVDRSAVHRGRTRPSLSSRKRWVLPHRDQTCPACHDARGVHPAPHARPSRASRDAQDAPRARVGVDTGITSVHG